MPRSRQSGVTLVELLIGLVILGVLVAWAVPSFVDLRDRQALRGAVDHLQGALAQARFEAIKRASPTTVDLAARLAELPDFVETVAEPTMGEEGVFVLEPRLAMLADQLDVGSVTLGVGPYQATFRVDVLGHGSACTPAGQPGVGYPECP